MASGPMLINTSCLFVYMNGAMRLPRAALIGRLFIWPNASMRSKFYKILFFAIFVTKITFYKKNFYIKMWYLQNKISH
jgi:hypothetical protein